MRWFSSLELLNILKTHGYYNSIRIMFWKVLKLYKRVYLAHPKTETCKRNFRHEADICHSGIQTTNTPGHKDRERKCLSMNCLTCKRLTGYSPIS